MSSSRSAPVIVAARRTAIGTAGHSFAAATTTDLAAPVLADLAGRVALLDRPIDDVVLGNCLGPGGNVARIAALAAGLGPTVPGMTVDRQCGSGLDAVFQAASRIGAGAAELVLAGGVESASTAPLRSWPAINGGEPQRYTRAPFAPPGWPDPEMGRAADDLARRRGLSRTRQDVYAARSHRLAAAAVASGRLTDEIVAVHGVTRDERPRAGMTAARLSRLRPAFEPDGTATAGNSCGISDGAAALALTSAAVASSAGLPGLRILGTAVTGGDPALPGAAIEPAVRKLLRQDKMVSRAIDLSQVGAIEITEAFASVALAAIEGLGLDPDVVCSDGGAIGFGHPWGASGAILLVRLFHRMLVPGGARLGLAACAIGGGQGIAMLLERTTA